MEKMTQKMIVMPKFALFLFALVLFEKVLYFSDDIRSSFNKVHNLVDRVRRLFADFDILDVAVLSIKNPAGVTVSPAAPSNSGAWGGKLLFAVVVNAAGNSDRNFRNRYYHRAGRCIYRVSHHGVGVHH